MIPQHYGLPWCDTVQFGIQMPKFTHVIRTNKMHTFYIVSILVPSTCFEQPSVHPQEELYMQVYGISFVLPCKQSGRWSSTRLLTVYGSAHFVGSYYVRISQCTVRKNVKYAEVSRSNLRPHLTSFCRSIHFLKLTL